MLLNSSTTYQLEIKSSFLGTDDFALIPEMFERNAFVMTPVGVQNAVWDIDNLIKQEYDELWSGEFNKILNANTVLSVLSSVAGSDAEKEELRKEAHFIRAYSNWTLAQEYCLPYNEANKAELGLPIKRTISFKESGKRASLADTYQFIEDDMKEALTTNVKFTAGSKNRVWRISKPAVYSFAARFYLSKNMYEKALEYAQLALTEHSAMVNYNTDMSYAEPSTKITVDGSVFEVKYPFTYKNGVESGVAWKEAYYFRTLQYSVGWFIPSESLLRLYDQTYDLRYRYHIVEHFSYIKGLKSPSYDYPGYMFLGRWDLPSGPSVAEMLLVKAECFARQGNVTEAMDAVNILRANRMDRSAPANVINLSASSPDEALTKILEERRRELPFTMRWFDIRRLNSNDDARDDVGDLSREFFDYNRTGAIVSSQKRVYTLPKNSRRYARPIISYEIQANGGELLQNKY